MRQLLRVILSEGGIIRQSILHIRCTLHLSCFFILGSLGTGIAMGRSGHHLRRRCNLCRSHNGEDDDHRHKDALVREIARAWDGGAVRDGLIGLRVGAEGRQRRHRCATSGKNIRG
jgi:hypothetical protein